MMIKRSRCRRSGSGGHEPGRGLDQHVRSLERLDPAHEQDHLGVLGHSELGPGLGLVAGMEGVQIDSRRHHRDLLGTGPVVALQLGRLVAGVRRQDVRRGDDLGLTALPHVGFGRVPVAAQLVLHPGHRVHGVHHRDAVPFAQRTGDHPGQPVVGVQHLVITDVRLHGGGEVVEVVRQILFGDVGHRSGRQLDHPGVLVDVHDVGDSRVGSSGEDVHAEPAFAEPLGQLRDVHVEATGVADARGGQRRGVQADHRDASRVGQRGAAARVGQGRRGRPGGRRVADREGSAARAQANPDGGAEPPSGAHLRPGSGVTPPH